MLTPAIQLFATELRDKAVLGQIEVSKTAPGFSLRHVLDSKAAPDSLTPKTASELRKLAMFTSAGAFRPLRSAPDLPHGWITSVATPLELERALNDIYPGALADWHAVRTGFARFTSFRSFAQRQTGLYGNLREITDPKAEVIAAACCADQACTRQRLWTVDGRPANQEFNHSRIPCLEPCAVFMEFARQSQVKSSQAMTALQLSALEIATVVAALETAAQHAGDCQADFKNALNVRRVLLCLENHAPKFRSKVPAKAQELVGLEESL